MRYYVASDIHSFYPEFITALTNAGYFRDDGEKKIIICGDLFDRGEESLKMQEFILKLINEDTVILIKGNHEDLFEEFCTIDDAFPYQHHLSNGTYQTALDLTGMQKSLGMREPFLLANACMETPYFKTIIPSMIDYYETEHYIFVHGWIPCFKDGRFRYDRIENWRECNHRDWAAARWFNGMDCARAGVTEPNKTIVCGHWHVSYGHSKFEHKGSEFGDDADFSPYSAPGILALDACTALSRQVNVVVIEDAPIAK